MKTLTAAIIGLGQVGWSFDEEPGRRRVWTHVGGYKASAHFATLLAFDPDPERRRRFAARHPDVQVADNLAAMLARRPDVVSICTPNETHAGVLEQVLRDAGPRAVWCEKPLATSLADGEAMVEQCRARGAALWVSHVRRWSPLWQAFRARLQSGEVGRLRLLRIAMPNRLWSVGSHGADLMLWLGGAAAEVRPLELPALAEAGEPACMAALRFASGAGGLLQVNGLKARLVVEAEALGDHGRLRLDEQRSTISLERFAASRRYAGYEELGEPATQRVEDESSPFTAIATEIAAWLHSGAGRPGCSGEDALETQRLLDLLAPAARPTVGRVA